MKAVFLLQSDPFRPRPALRALRQAETLRDAGWDVSFVAWIKGEMVRFPEGQDSFPVERVHQPVPLLGTSFLGRAQAYRRATMSLERAAVRAGCDLLVAHDFEVLRAAVRAKRRTGTPLVYDAHEDWPALIAERSSWEARLAATLERRFCGRVDHVTTVSEPIAAKFRTWGRPTDLLYNARPSGEVHLADRATSRRAFRYGREDFVVGFAGALAPGRGLEVLLDALPTLPSAKALIAGGPRTEAEQLLVRASRLGLSDRVRVDGYQPFSKLPPYYAAMDVGVILLEPRPNHLRALPNKLFDYMAYGVPVLVPDYPGMAPLVRRTGAGVAISAVEPSIVADGLSKLRADSSARAAMREKGRASFLREYAWELQARRFLSIAETLVRRSRTST